MVGKREVCEVCNVGAGHGTVKGWLNGWLESMRIRFGWWTTLAVRSPIPRAGTIPGSRVRVCPG